MGPANCLRSGLRQSQEANLAGPDLFGHGADGLLDRDERVDAVLVVEINVVHTQALERTVARAAHVRWRAIDGPPHGCRIDADSELHCDEHVVMTLGQSTRKQSLVRMGS